MLPPLLVINLALESRNTKQPQSSVITQFVSKPFCYHFSMIKGDISTPNRTVLWARITLMLSSLHSIYIKSVHLVHKYFFLFYNYSRRWHFFLSDTFFHPHTVIRKLIFFLWVWQGSPQHYLNPYKERKPN